MRWHTWSMLVVVSLVLPGSVRADEPIYQGRTLAEWIADLNDPKWEIERTAVQSLAVFGPKKDVVSALAAALKSEDAGVVLSAAGALGKFGLKAKESLPELRVAYKRLSAGPPPRKGDKKYSEEYLKTFTGAQRAVAEALILIDDHPGPEFAPILLEALKTDDAEKRRDIVIKLGKLGPAAAQTTVPALIHILKDTEEAARRPSSQRIGHFDPLSGHYSLSSDLAKEIRLEAVKSLGRIGPAAKPALHALTLTMKLAAPERNARVQQLETLDGPVGSDQGKVRRISFTIVTGDKAMLRACVEALGRIRPEAKGTMGALRVALRDLDEGVRWAALCALLESGQDTKEVVPILLNFLRDKNAALRRAAVKALGKSGAEKKQVLPALIAALKDKEANTRAAAAESLRKIGAADKEVIQALIAVLGDSEIAVVREASLALAKFGPKGKAALPRALALLDNSIAEKRLMGCFVLAAIGPPAKEAVSALEKIARADDSTEYVRLAAFTALAGIDPSRRKATLPRLITALQGDGKKDTDVIEVAAMSLLLIGRGDPEVLSSLRKQRDKTSNTGVRQVIEVVIRVFEHPEKDIFDLDAIEIEPDIVPLGHSR